MYIYIYLCVCNNISWWYGLCQHPRTRSLSFTHGHRNYTPHTRDLVNKAEPNDGSFCHEMTQSYHTIFAYIYIYIYHDIYLSLSLIICICIYIYVYYVCVWYSSILIYHQKIRKLRVQSLHPRGLVPRAATNLIRYSSLLSQLQDVSQVGQTEFDLHELKISLINWQHQGVSKHDIIWYLPIVACGFAVLSSNTLGKS